ncbi:hypothetical protein ACLKMH_14800 [Psychromonas sp. KJ10-10]|uniref:hypothetical protein n=1 Tax=Psychromonas sp. KJ10-10 TaxID=3391823 RepID=UPI0039B6274D
MPFFISNRAVSSPFSENTLKRVFTGIFLLTFIIFYHNAQAHSGHLNEKSIAVCVDKERSNNCQYEGAHNDLYIGSCQYMVETLICVRNQPIQKISVNQSLSPAELLEEGHSHKD